MINSSYIEYLYENPPLGWQIKHPSTYYFFAFEMVDPHWWHDFIKSRYYYTIYAAIAYLTGIIALQRYMRDKPAYDLKKPLFYWNLSLSVFSIVGFARTLPGFVSTLIQPNGFYNSMCIRGDMTLPQGFWALMFAISKFVELGDTVFLLLRKKPLMFIHWFHHLIAMTTIWILSEILKRNFAWNLQQMNYKYCV